MLFKEAISSRIIELCNKYDYSPNKLTEISAIPPSTLRSLLSYSVENPSFNHKCSTKILNGILIQNIYLSLSVL